MFVVSGWNADDFWLTAAAADLLNHTYFALRLSAAAVVVAVADLSIMQTRTSPLLLLLLYRVSYHSMLWVIKITYYTGDGRRSNSEKHVGK